MFRVLYGFLSCCQRGSIQLLLINQIIYYFSHKSKSKRGWGSVSSFVSGKKIRDVVTYVAKKFDDGKKEMGQVVIFVITIKRTNSNG